MTILSCSHPAVILLDCGRTIQRHSKIGICTTINNSDATWEEPQSEQKPNVDICFTNKIYSNKRYGMIIPYIVNVIAVLSLVPLAAGRPVSRQSRLAAIKSKLATPQSIEMRWSAVHKLRTMCDTTLLYVIMEDVWLVVFWRRLVVFYPSTTIFHMWWWWWWWPVHIFPSNNIPHLLSLRDRGYVLLPRERSLLFM